MADSGSAAPGGAGDADAGRSVRVVVRIRPLQATDGATATSLLQYDPSKTGEVVLSAPEGDRKTAKRFTFDCVFGTETTQVRAACPLCGGAVLHGRNHGGACTPTHMQ